MCRRVIVAILSLAIGGAAPAGGVFAQQGLPQLPPPPAAPVKPYQPVAVTPPAPLNDPSFVAFRQQLADVASRKDRTALATLVAQNFFWVQDKDLADKTKPGVDNLAKAVALEAPDGAGWRILTGYSQEPSASESEERKGLFCAPADPGLDTKAFDALRDATGTDPAEWGFPNKTGIEVHAAAQPGSPVTEKPGMVLIRVLQDSGPPANPNDPMFLHVATPSGKTGFIDAQSLSPLIGDQMCYAKDAGAWKIAGYFGGMAQ